MIKRTLEASLRKASSQYPVVTLTGPRQSGKTTLVRAAFPNRKYLSLEDPDQRSFALQDPRGFLSQFRGNAILDEVQRTPSLFSYIQTIVDETDSPGQFVLTGSQNFLLLERISQSLAGRCAVLHLLPFSLGELEGREPLRISGLGSRIPKRECTSRFALTDLLFHGFYPRIHDKGLDPGEWLSNYYRTYVERDVREIVNVGDMEAFGRFVRMSAGRNGQLLNLSSLANDCGITHTTARRWISILEASFIVHLLRPHFRNFSKRLIKSPKLYFLDTGLLCYLLGIRSPEDLLFSSSRGAVFESLVVSEVLKNCLHRNEEPGAYFWRDSTGHEIDLLLDRAGRLLPIEIKSGQTIAEDFFAGISFWRKLTDSPTGPAGLVYGGDTSFMRSGVAVYSWKCL